MNQVIIKSDHKEPLVPLISDAIEYKKNELIIGINKTKAKLKQFENKYNLISEDFHSNPESVKISDELESLEWLGEYETYQILANKLQQLEELELC